MDTWTQAAPVEGRGPPPSRPGGPRGHTGPRISRSGSGRDVPATHVDPLSEQRGDDNDTNQDNNPEGSSEIHDARLLALTTRFWRVVEIEHIFNDRAAATLLALSAIVIAAVVAAVATVVSLAIRPVIITVAVPTAFIHTGGARRALQDLVQLATIEPDPPALRTLIDFGPLAIGDAQLGSINGAIHAILQRLPPLGARRPFLPSIDRHGAASAFPRVVTCMEPDPKRNCKK